MKKKPLVSVIIPTYNRAHLIGETLDSVLAQTYQNWECIVVDDGSSDDTDKVVGEYVKKDSRFKYFHRPEDYAKGANSCRHVGFLKSKGDYVNWFDSDDIMLPNHFEIKIHEIIKGNYDFVCCEIARFKYDNKKDVTHIDYYYREGMALIDQFIGNYTMSTPGPLWSRLFLLKNKLYYKLVSDQKKDTVLNDWTFGLDALMTTENFSFIKEPLVLYRFHDNSIYSDRLKANPQKYLDEFKIRKDYFKKLNKEIGYNFEVEKYYTVRNLKILRNLLIKKSKTKHVLKEILKSNYLNIITKMKFSFYYILAVIFHKGINKLKSR